MGTFLATCSSFSRSREAIDLIKGERIEFAGCIVKVVQRAVEERTRSGKNRLPFPNGAFILGRHRFIIIENIIYIRARDCGIGGFRAKWEKEKCFTHYADGGVAQQFVNSRTLCKNERMLCSRFPV